MYHSDQQHVNKTEVLFTLIQNQYKSKKKERINKTYIIDVELVLLYYEKEETCETDAGRERIEFLLGCIESQMSVGENIEDDQSVMWW